MPVPDGAPPKITGDDITSRVAAGLSNNPQMFLVGKTTPANAVTILPSWAVDRAVSDEGPKTPEYQPPAPSKLTMT